MERRGEVNLTDLFGYSYPSTKERLAGAYQDSVVHDRSAQVMKSTGDERAALEAQLVTYLAAGHILFSEETRNLIDSLKR